MLTIRSLLLAALLMTAVASRAWSAVEAIIDCGAIPAGIASPVINISFQMTPECPGGQPPIRGMVVDAADGLASPMTAVAKAAAIAAAINADPGNIGCAAVPGLNAVVVPDPGTGQLTRVEISPVEAGAHIAALQVNDNTRSAGSVKGKTGTSSKALAVSGVAAGGSVTVTVNPTVTVNTEAGQSSDQVLLNISAALNGVGFSHSVVTLAGSTLLQGGSPPAPTILTNRAIIAPGIPAIENGVWVESNDPGLRGVKQVNLTGDTNAVPTLPQWGLIVLASGVLGVGVRTVARRRTSPADPAG